MPGQFDAQNQGLVAQAQQANQDILSAAQQRGLGFSGIPIGEQAKYNATTFMPAVAKLKSDQLAAQDSLSGQLNQINLAQNTQAQSILSAQQAADQQQKQFEEQLAAQREQAAAALKAQQTAAGAYSLGGSSGGGGSAPSGNPFAGAPAMAKRANGGFNFTDSNGQAISAARYAALTGTPIRNLLQTMANQGDTGALAGLQFIGSDGKADGNKLSKGVEVPGFASMSPAAVQNIYRSLTW